MQWQKQNTDESESLDYSSLADNTDVTTPSLQSG